MENGHNRSFALQHERERALYVGWQYPVAGGRPPGAVSYCGPLFLQQVSNITTFCISVVYNGAQVSIYQYESVKYFNTVI